MLFCQNHTCCVLSCSHGGLRNADGVLFAREARFDLGSPHAAKEQPEQTAGAAGVEAVKDPKISEAMNDTKAVEAEPVKVGESEQQVANKVSHHPECLKQAQTFRLLRLEGPQIAGD